MSNAHENLTEAVEEVFEYLEYDENEKRLSQVWENLRISLKDSKAEISAKKVKERMKNA